MLVQKSPKRAYSSMGSNCLGFVTPHSILEGHIGRHPYNDVGNFAFAKSTHVEDNLQLIDDEG